MEKMKFYSLWICLICIVFFLFQIVSPAFTELLVLDSSSFYEPWRFLSAIFLHGSLTHLLYNLFALALFGTILEGVVGGRKMLTSFFVGGIIANIISVNFYNSSLGASGAIFAVIGSLIVVRPLMVVYAFGLPMPMFAAGILWVIGDLIGAYGFLAGNPLDSTGNIAHLSGILIGLILGLIYRTSLPKETKARDTLRLDESSMRRWEDHYLR